MFLKENNGKPLPLLMQCCFQVIRKNSTVWKQFHCFSHCWRHVIQSPKWYKVKFVHTLFIHLYLVVITSGCSRWYKTQKSSKLLTRRISTIDRISAWWRYLEWPINMTSIFIPMSWSFITIQNQEKARKQPTVWRKVQSFLGQLVVQKYDHRWRE